MIHEIFTSTEPLDIATLRSKHERYKTLGETARSKSITHSLAIWFAEEGRSKLIELDQIRTMRMDNGTPVSQALTSQDEGKKMKAIAAIWIAPFMGTIDSMLEEEPFDPEVFREIIDFYLTGVKGLMIPSIPSVSKVEVENEKDLQSPNIKRVFELLREDPTKIILLNRKGLPFIPPLMRVMLIRGGAFSVLQGITAPLFYSKAIEIPEIRKLLPQQP